MTFRGEQFCDIDSVNNEYSGLFEHDMGTSLIVVNDSLITDENVGLLRATAELIKGSYAEKWITLETLHTPHLKQNDVFIFKGAKWIVKEISLSFRIPELSQTIKGVRYE